MRSMTAFNCAFGSVARWDRPSHALAATVSADQPGCFAQGPDEKSGRAGLTPGIWGNVMDALHRQGEIAEPVAVRPFTDDLPAARLLQRNIGVNRHFLNDLRHQS